MESIQLGNAVPQHESSGKDQEFVPITVDGNLKHVLEGRHIVSTLKAEVGVPKDYELDQVIQGEFQALADDAPIHIKGHEVFVSHVRRGGSS